MPGDVRVGLVLSGGFAKGAYQIGVLKALKEYFDPAQIKYVSASSVGALNAYAFTRDKISAAEKMWLNCDCASFRAFVKSYMRGPTITNMINKVVSEPLNPQSCFYAAYFNASDFRLNYVNLNEINQNDVKDYLQACVTLPVLSRSLEIAGKRYVDGAIIDNIPVRPLMEHPFDYAVVVHFDNDNYIFENDYFDSKLIKINFLDDKVIKSSLAFDRNSITYMIDYGYEKSMELFGIIFKNGTQDIDYICKKIKFINDIRGNKKFRLTGDVVVNNVNKVLKKIISSKI